MASPITFSGAASGLDTTSIIEALLGLKQQRIDRLNSRLNDIQSQKDAISDLKGILSTLNSKAADLATDVIGKLNATSSDDEVFTAEASGDAVTGEYTLKVDNLAQQSVATIGGTLSSASEQIGAGIITLTTGAESVSVTLTDGASTLADLRQAINDEAGDTFRANIIEVSPGSHQLVVTTVNSGADQDIVEGPGNSEITGFSNATFTSPGIVKTKDGEDASFEVDGLTITRPTNEISDVIEGVTLTLRNESPNYQTLDVGLNVDDIISGMQEFVDTYNEAQSKLVSLSQFGGTLSGDTAIRSLKAELQSMFTGYVDNMANLNVRDDGTVGFTSLSQIGFKSEQRTGTISIDTDDLREALEENYDEVKNLFNGATLSSSPNADLLIDTSVGFSGTVLLDMDADTATIGGDTYNLVRDGDFLRFAEGDPYYGMTFTASGSGTATLEISAGLSRMLEDITDRYVDFSGILADRTSSLDRQEDRVNDSMDLQTMRLENERARLERIFANAEEAISQLNALQASMNAQVFK